MDQHASPIIAIVAGEPSGDLLGAELVRALRQHYPDARFIGVAGPCMLAEGVETAFPMERLTVMGITEVLPRLPELFKRRRQLVDWFVEEQPLVCIGIDAPDFNLRVAKWLHRRGLRTVHYVSPTVWAWRQGRVDGIRRCIDLMLCLFPFEAQFYQAHGVPVATVGHPLADMISTEQDVSVARKALPVAIAPDEQVLAVLPGSREGEVAQLLPDFIRAVARLREHYPDLRVLIAAADAARRAQIAQGLETLGEAAFDIIEGRSREVMAAADLVLLASGTATLEAALLRKPMVVGYRVSSLTYAIVRRLVKVSWVSQPNLLAGKELVPEFLQDALTPDALSDALRYWIEHPEATAALQSEYAVIHESLGGGSAQRAARAIAGLIDHHV